MTHEIQEGLNQLFDMILPLSGEFKKKTYEQIFRDQYEKYRPLMEKIARMCEEAEDQKQSVEEVAFVIPGRMREILEKERTKRRRDTVLMKYNLGMVTFVIPIFRYGRVPVMELVVDRMIELWNDNDSDMDIGKSTFEEIQGGFKSHPCYITTAVCESLGKPDDCYELNLLREYRDGYLAGSKDGYRVIHEYYNVAPTIVKRISRMEHADEIYRKIWEEYLSRCVELIEEGRKMECQKVYTDMVYELEEKYLYPVQ
ncbi:CFI-box-CTERM domain-containing protein [Roseburia hominis]